MQSLARERATTGWCAEGFKPRLGSACSGARIGCASFGQRQYAMLHANAGHDHRAIATIDDDVNVQSIDAITHD